MTAVALFGATLVAAALVSDIARRSVLSTAVLFLAVGLVAGAAGGVAPANGGLVSGLATVALVAVLFGDGMRMGLADLKGAWRLPGRVLLVGLPVTLAITAGFARLVLGLTWVQAFLVGAALSPTDPVFARAIVGRDEVPGRTRHLLNVESGLNDGLALPVVVVLLAVARGDRTDLLVIGGQLLGGLALGVAVPLVVVGVRLVTHAVTTARYEPLLSVGIVVAVFGAAEATGLNAFLAAFAAGATVATVAPGLRKSYAPLGERISELLKLGALLAFGALLTNGSTRVPPGAWVLAPLALLVARPVAVVLSLVGGSLSRQEVVTVAWFGPKGFASVVYALIILDAGVPGSERLYGAIALVTAASIVVHSSTDVLVARSFVKNQSGAGREHPERSAPRQ